VGCAYNTLPQSELRLVRRRLDARQFFLEQYDTVRFIVNDLFLKGLTDDQIRHQPTEGLNSIAWHLWHTSRWQDFANTLTRRAACLPRTGTC
jgi:DinB superfamily